MKQKERPAQLPLSGSEPDKRAGRRFVHEHSTPIFVGRQVVGQVQDGTFHKAVQSSRHMLRRPPAWALDMQSLTDAEAAGAKRVVIHDRDSGRTYVASTALIRQGGFQFDRGFGEQIGLPLTSWQVERPDEPQQLAFAFGSTP